MLWKGTHQSSLGGGIHNPSPSVTGVRLYLGKVSPRTLAVSVIIGDHLPQSLLGEVNFSWQGVSWSLCFDNSEDCFSWNSKSRSKQKQG